MILQKLYNDYNFNIELILTSEYKKLGLNSNELIILLVLFSDKSKKKIFSLASIARKVEFNQNEIANIVTGLLEKDFIEIKLETHNKKEREIYSLDKTFKQVQNMIEEEIKKMSEEIAYLEGFLKSVMAKLNNEKFVANANPAVVEGERKKKEDAESKIATLKKSIEDLQK